MDLRDSILETLNNVFHHNSFKSELQESAIRCIAGGMYTASSRLFNCIVQITLYFLQIKVINFNH